MSAMTFLLMQATSGLVVIGEPHLKTMPLEDATEGAQPLTELVSKANGNVSMCRVQPGMMTAADDTAVFACVGVAQSGATEWKLLNADQTHSNWSACVVDKDGAQNWLFSGQHIRLTQRMAGNGRMTPIFATMTGLHADKLPLDMGCAQEAFAFWRFLDFALEAVMFRQREQVQSHLHARMHVMKTWILQRGDSLKSTMSGFSTLLSVLFGKWTAIGIPLLLFRTG
jgi:hypothetical protein